MPDTLEKCIKLSDSLIDMYVSIRQSTLPLTYYQTTYIYYYILSDYLVTIYYIVYTIKIIVTIV